MSTSKRIPGRTVENVQNEAVRMKCSRAVVYFDGTPSSILAAMICADAFGEKNVYCITTTDVGSMNVSRAGRAAQRLGVNHMIIPIVLPVASIVSQVEYSGVRVSHRETIAQINRDVTHAVMKSVASEVEALRVSTIHKIAGYDPLADYDDDELIALYSYYNISLDDNQEEEKHP